MPPTVDHPDRITGRRVLVVEDGPTLTHGGMTFGAGVLVARRYEAGCLVDPRPYATGSLNRTFRQYPHLGPLLPAMGYGPEQVRELEDTIERVECDLVVIATPMDLRRVIRVTKPTVRVRYDVEDRGRPTLTDVMQGVIDKAKQS